MNKKLVFFAILLSVVFCMFSCIGINTKPRMFADDSETTVTAKIKPFTTLVVDGPYDIHFCQSDSGIVKMVGTQEDIKKVMLHNRGNKLYISRKHKLLSIGGDDEVDIYIYAPNLVSLDMRGTGDFICKRNLDTDTLRLFMRGTGDVELGNVLCDNFYLIMRGTGDVDVDELQTVSSQIALYGTGDIKLLERGVAYTSLQIVGCGDADVSLENCGTADCCLAGTGDITLKGNLKKLTKTKRGTGEIDVKHLKVGNE